MIEPKVVLERVTNLVVRMAERAAVCVVISGVAIVRRGDRGGDRSLVPHVLVSEAPERAQAEIPLFAEAHDADIAMASVGIAKNGVGVARRTALACGRRIEIALSSVRRQRACTDDRTITAIPIQNVPRGFSRAARSRPGSSDRQAGRSRSHRSPKAIRATGKGS